MSNLEKILSGKEIRDLYTASLENLLKSGELNHFKYSDLIEKFKPEIEDLVLKCSDKETDLDVEYYFYNLRFSEILYPRARYARYYLLYLETKYKKVLTLKYSVKFIEHFKLEDENVTPQHISIFKIQYKLKEKSTQDKIKQVLSRPEDAYINDKFFLDKLNKEMDDKFISLYKEMYLEIAPLYYILSRYCVELRIEDSSLEHNEFGRRVFGEDGDSAFVGRFLPSYRGQMGITLNNRQYKIITNYFNGKTRGEKKICQQPGKDSTQAENNKVYWRGQARKALEEDEFNLLEKCVRSFLPKNGYVACVIP